jgi:hypothetical protein
VLDLVNDTIDYEDLDKIVFSALIAAAQKGDIGCKAAIRALADKFAYHATDEDDSPTIEDLASLAGRVA